MKRYERTWPVAALAIGVGAVAGWALLGPPSVGAGPSPAERVSPRDGLRGPIAPPPRPRPPPSYTPPMVLSNSGTYKALEKLRTSTNPAIRASSAGILSLSVEPERVLPALTRALESDGDEFVRLVAAQSIGRLGAGEGLAPLMRAATGDTSERVRTMAIEAHDSLMARVPIVEEDGPLRR